MNSTAIRVSALCLSLLGPVGLAAQDAPQSASSARHFLASFEFGSGGRTVSTKHVLDASSGSGAVANRASTTRHVLTGGFNASFDVPTTGKPWLSAVRPRFTAMRSGATLTIHGTHLKAGSAVDIGGQAATILSNAPDKITVRVPNQSEPGFRPVTVKAGTSATTLPQGLGVLPLVYEENAAASDVPFTLVFKGTKGDTVVWAIGILPSTPIPLGNFGYGLAINPAAILVLPGFGITDQNGEFRMRFPAQTYLTGQVLAQAVFVSSNPGYAPGAFSNLVRL